MYILIKNMERKNRKYKFFPSEEAWYEAAQNKPRKTFKKIFKAMKKEKNLSRGVTIGGDNMDVYMPQFIKIIFKENLEYK